MGCFRYIASSAVVLAVTVGGCGVIRDPDLVVVARIGDQKLTMGELTQHIAHMPFQQRSQLQSRDAKLAVLKEMVDRRILVKEAESLGIESSMDDMLVTLRAILQAQGDERAQTLPPDELVKLIDPEAEEDNMPSDRVLKEYGQGEHDVKAMHDERRIEKIELRERVVEETLIRKLFESQIFSQLEITETDLRDFYDANIEKMEMPALVRFRYMTLPDKDTAQTILKRVENGESFEKTVASAAADPDGLGAAEMPNFMPLERIPEDIRVLLADAKPGDIAGPVVRGDNNYDLVQVIEHSPARVLEFDEVKEQIAGQAVMAKRRKSQFAYIRDLHEKYGVEIFDDKIHDTSRFERTDAH